MNIKIISRGGKCYAIVQNYNSDISQYYMVSSWDAAETEKKYFGKELTEEGFRLLDEEVDLVSSIIEIPEIKNPLHYVTLILVTESGYEFPTHIDYKTYHGIEEDETLYVHKHNMLVDEQNNSYKLTIRGVYGDEHQARIVSINDKDIRFTVPKKSTLDSECYDIFVYENNKKIYRSPLRIMVRDSLSFIFTPQDMGQYIKYNVMTKFNYPVLKGFKIKHNGSLMTEYSNEKLKDNKDFHFFVSNPGFGKTLKFDVEYQVVEDTLDETVVKKNAVILSDLYSNMQLEIFDLKVENDFLADSALITWDTKGIPSNSLFSVYVGGKFIGNTNETHMALHDVRSFNNGTKSINVTIKCNINGSYGDSDISCSIETENYMFIDSPRKFNPIIDYSDCFRKNKTIGRLMWSRPEYYCTFRMKLEVENVDRFLEEFAKPWSNEKMYYSESEKFDERYDDYEKQYLYDFNASGEKFFSTPFDSVISFEGKNGFINIGADNFVDIPLWLCKSDSEYVITIEVVDRWGNITGSSVCDFKLLESDVSIFTEDFLKLRRNQYMQFGESGTVGEFFKKVKPTPLDSKFSYSKEYKVYDGAPLYDFSNTDFEGNSMAYYMSRRFEAPLDITFKRNCNFYEFKYSIEKEEEPIIGWTTIVPKGDNFSENVININRSNFNKDGEYNLKIQTFNASGQVSPVNSFNFFVHSDTPETPEVKIKEDDFDMENEEIVINKKYFEISISNNEPSKKYSGWIYKEGHFFFKKKGYVYNEYPDYIAQSSREDGTLTMRNTVPIENGEYSCKVVAYDYAGNQSEQVEFNFTLKAKIVLTPEAIYFNDVKRTVNWKIKKPQDCEGIFYYFMYSADGEETNYVKLPEFSVHSPYYVDDPNTSQVLELDLPFYGEGEGFYILRAYEYNAIHPMGQPEYYFSSPTVEVKKAFNVSPPIYCRSEAGKVAVFDKSTYHEWAYTSDLNNLVFDTIHSEVYLDDPNTPEIEGKHYKLILVNPDGANSYSAQLPIPVETGDYTFGKIAELCGVQDQTEGVWTIQFITIDKYGNTNEGKGHYTYYVNVVKRDPVINSMTPVSLNSYGYFGISSTQIGYFIDTNAAYEDILNFSDYSDKFAVNSFKISFTDTPGGKNYSITSKRENDGSVSFMNPLTVADKETHSKDGAYSTLVTCIDPIGRESYSKVAGFKIDTKLESDIIFVGNGVVNSSSMMLKAIADGEVERVYYEFSESGEAPETGYATWSNITPSELTEEVTGDSFFGVEFSCTAFENDGYKTIFYVIEEKSGNISEVRSYKFKLDTKTINRPFFDYDNKVYYSNLDSEIKLTWNKSSSDINDFDFRLDLVEVDADGNIEVIRTYLPSVVNTGSWIPVGPSDNPFLNLGNTREISIPCSDNSFIISGSYMATVKGWSVFGELEENSFIFQYDNATLEVAKLIADSNKITVSSNVVTWSHIALAAYYEFSYDSKSWIKTYDNKFFINRNKLITDSNGEVFVYVRWRAKNGITSEITQIKLYVNIEPIENPVVEFANGNVKITGSNKVLDWNVIFENPEKVHGFYYSFDKSKWAYKPVSSVVTKVNNKGIDYPVADGYYDIFVKSVEKDPVLFPDTNVGDIVHNYVRVFAQDIKKVDFDGIVSGKVYNDPKRLFIIDKQQDVDYFIYVNGKLVDEGYEISTGTLSRFDITVKAKKKGLEKLHDVITENDQLHMWSFVTGGYILDIGNSKVMCEIDESNMELKIHSMPNTSVKKIIMYKEKSTENWKVLRVGDKLSLYKEWEFHISTFNML